MPVPIACSLTAAGARAQLDEWRDVLGASVTGTHRISPTELSFRLRGDLAQLVAITRLAQREKACCPFFSFTIRIDADAVTLHVCVPDEAAPVLDRFVPLSTPAPAGADPGQDGATGRTRWPAGPAAGQGSTVPG